MTDLVQGGPSLEGCGSKASRLEGYLVREKNMQKSATKL